MDNLEPQDLSALFAPTEVVADQVAAAARAYLAARAAKDQAEQVMRRAHEALDQAERTLLNSFQAAQMTSLKIKEGEQVIGLSSSRHDYYAAPQGGLDDIRFYQWLLRAGGQDLVKRSIHHQTFSSFCRELAQQGKPIHPDVRKTEIAKISVRRT